MKKRMVFDLLGIISGAMQNKAQLERKVMELFIIERLGYPAAFLQAHMAVRK